METLIEGGSFKAVIDEQVVFSQLGYHVNAVWSLLLATGYLKVLQVENADADDEEKTLYTLALTNFETVKMFRNMVSSWFGGDTGIVYNEFIKAMLCDNVRRMNTFMNKVALRTFSMFDSENHPSEDEY